MDHTTARRLALIKYIWRRADEVCDQPEPLSSVSILEFHDAIELFLQLASEYVDSGAPQPAFMDYWELIAKKLLAGISHKEAMRRLNKARVALKHHGTMPSALDIDTFRVSVRDFFETNTPRVFGVSFQSVSLTTFVQPEIARTHLESALRLAENNELEKSLEESASAFHHVLKHADKAVSNRWGLSPFDSHYEVRRIRRTNIRELDDRDGEFRRFTEGVANSLEELYEAMRLISLGVDYHRYLRFRQATPHVFQTGNGELHLSWTRAFVSSPEFSSPLAQFAIDFVIDTALVLTGSAHIHRLFVGPDLPRQS